MLRFHRSIPLAGLDVFVALCPPPAILAECSGLAAYIANAVSYTHLDVYKRQVGTLRDGLIGSTRTAALEADLHVRPPRSHAAEVRFLSGTLASATQYRYRRTGGDSTHMIPQRNLSLLANLSLIHILYCSLPVTNPSGLAQKRTSCT